MEKSGMYNRQSILMRKNTRTVDKNHTMLPIEERKMKVISDFKKNKIDIYHNYLRVEHFGTRDEKNYQKTSLKKEADLQLQIKQQIKAEEKLKNQLEDRQMLKHLKQQLQRDAESKMIKKQNLTKISTENKHTATFQKNVKQMGVLEDKVHERHAVQNHDLGYKISFY